MIGTRFISAIIGLVLLVIVLLSNEIFVGIGVAVISIMALYELLTALGYIKQKPLIFACFGGSIILIILPYLQREMILMLLYIYIMALFIIILKYHKIIVFGDISAVFFASVYICFLLSHITFTRMLPNGKILVWLIFIGAWMTDTCAFFAGTFFGRHKLFPEVSPKKTIEGSLGGIIGCVLSFILFGFMVEKMYLYSVNYANLSVLGLLCSIMGQLGDLSASVIKRKYGIKDFGNIMPGHGGIMDRFDSVIFVAPLVYYYLIFFKVI